MTIPRLVLATKNPGKVEEMKGLVLGLGLATEVVEGLDWPDVEETGDTLKDNALLKASAVVEATGLPALADDSGLEVTALGGRPGVYSARYAGPDATFDDNIDKLLDELSGSEDRSARFVTVVALMLPDGDCRMGEGDLLGTIGEHRTGEGGFGYDPVFLVGGTSLAEMSTEDKNGLSHRAKAIEALARAG